MEKKRKGIKESLRKFIVSIKRKPHNIAIVVYAIAFFIFSLNVTNFSDSTAKIGTKNMGFCVFVAMLLSILAFVCLFNSFPKREKVKWIMLVIFAVMMVIVITCDISYLSKLYDALANPELTLAEADLKYVNASINAIYWHISLIGVTGLLLATLPLYKKALMLINTSIKVEENANISEIDIDKEED